MPVAFAAATHAPEPTAGCPPGRNPASGLRRPFSTVGASRSVPVLAGRLMRFFQVNDLAGLSRRFFRLIEPSDPTFHLGTALEQVGKFLPTVFADLTQLLNRIQLHWWLRMVRRVVELVELNEVTVTNCGGDMADTVVLVVSAGKNKKHADEMGLLVLHGVMPLLWSLRADRRELLRLYGPRA